MLLHDLVSYMDYTKDYYRIRGVTPDSDTAAIRAAYKTLMVKYDPDHNRSAEAPGITKSLTEAINTLDNEICRKKYDQYRLKSGGTGTTIAVGRWVLQIHHPQLGPLLAH